MYLANSKAGVVRCYQVEDIEVVWDDPPPRDPLSHRHFKEVPVPVQKKQARKVRSWTFPVEGGGLGMACVERTRERAIATISSHRRY
jgi:hypothetical protein